MGNIHIFYYYITIVILEWLLVAHCKRWIMIDVPWQCAHCENQLKCWSLVVKRAVKCLALSSQCHHSTLSLSNISTILISFRDMAATLDCQERCLLSGEFRRFLWESLKKCLKRSLGMSRNPTGIICKRYPVSGRPGEHPLCLFFRYVCVGVFETVDLKSKVEQMTWPPFHVVGESFEHKQQMHNLTCFSYCYIWKI